MNKVSVITGPPDAHRARLHPTRKAEDVTDEDASGYRRSEGLFQGRGKPLFFEEMNSIQDYRIVLYTVEQIEGLVPRSFTATFL